MERILEGLPRKLSRAPSGASTALEDGDDDAVRRRPETQSASEASVGDWKRSFASSPEDSGVTRDLVAAGIGRLEEQAIDSADPLRMDEDAFRAFYDLTSRAVWGYLSHVTGDPHAADDLLQETYIRFLGVRRRWESDSHRRNYLFRIATNLAHDRHRRNARRETHLLDEERGSAEAAAQGAGHGHEEQADLRRALGRLSPREREMLWLAYAEGATHQEIAETLGLRARGIRVLLFRARKKLAAMLRGSGVRGLGSGVGGGHGRDRV
jgi:RNA polymerase sigma-70 factor (ECF subfamily)